jgi:PAS domain S-box-containing protein
LLSGIAGLALMTFAAFHFGFGIARTGFAYVILIALLSLFGSFSASVILSILGAACLNYFFAPPLFEFRIDLPDDIERIAVFLTASLIVAALTTRRKRAEQALAESKARLEEAQRIAHVGWWERDLLTDRVTVSDEVVHILGERPVGRWLYLLHPDDRARAAEAAAAAIRPGGPRYDVEYRVLRPDGSLRFVHSRADTTCDSAGRPVRQFGVLQDITELRQAEQELRKSEISFRTFVDHATDAFFLLDANWILLDVNRQACASLGYSREELIGKPKRELDVELDDASIQRLKQRMLAGEAITFETRHRRKDGTSFPVEVRVGQFEQGGRRYLCLARDITERKRAEDELRDSEERFRTLVQFSFDVYWESDAQHRFTRQEFAAALSDAPAPGSEIGKTRWEVPYVEPDENGWRKHRETMDAHLPFRDFELARPTPEGGKRYVSVSGMPVFDKAGRFIGYRGVGRHITDRKLIELSLRQRERELREIVETIPVMTVAVLPDGSSVFIGKRFAEYSGLSEQDGQGSGWKACVHPDDLHLHMRQWRASLKSGEPVEIETRFRRADGEYRWFLARATPLRDESGNILKWYEALTDIEDRIRAEEALRRSEAYLAATQRQSHTGTWVFDGTGSLYWSEECYRIWGLDSEQGLPTRDAIRERIHPDDRDMVAQAIKSSTRQRSAYAADFRIVLPDGTVKYIESRSIGVPLFSADGKIVEVLGTDVDVTERKRAEREHERLRELEAELAHVNRLSIMGELTASLAHEILHPIATARNNARAGMRFLERSPANLAEVKEALACIVRDADRAKDIVDRMREHIKKAPPRREPFDVNEAIREVIEMVQNAIHRNRISVRTHLMDEMNSVRGDRVQLQQVMLNLLLNAVEAMSSVEKGARELLISTREGDNADIVVAVEDSGPGIDSQEAERVFAPFYTTKSGGIGMGLSICRSIIAAHGGRLWAEANQPRGAIFQFNLPARVDDS